MIRYTLSYPRHLSHIHTISARSQIGRIVLEKVKKNLIVLDPDELKDRLPSISNESQLDASFMISSDISDKNSSQSSYHEVSTPPQKLNLIEIRNPSQLLPTKESILMDFEEWLITMDGGSQSNYLAYKSKLVIQKLIRSIGLERIMEPKMIYKYFESAEHHRQQKYIPNISSFILYTHQEYPNVCNTEKHHQMNMRISR